MGNVNKRMGNLIKFIKSIVIFIFGEDVYFYFRWLFKYSFKYIPIWCYQRVEGWLPEIEAIELYELGKSLPYNRPVIVEIGSWMGRSAVVFAKSIKDKFSGCVYCIDPFDGSGDDISVLSFRNILNNLDMTLKEKFINNINSCKVGKYIRVLEGYSYNVVKDWHENIDLLFIDGDHSYESVKKDYLLWDRFVKVGGYIVFHDVFLESNIIEDKKHPSGPTLVVKEYILPSDKWACKRSVGSLFIAKKVKE
jgi:cephalosporin hydroxylase